VGRATGVSLEDDTELDGLDGGIARDVVDANGGGREVVEGHVENRLVEAIGEAYGEVPVALREGWIM